MGRDRYRHPDSIISDDSTLLDIISNVLGIMIFLAVIIMLLPSSKRDKPREITSLAQRTEIFLHKKMPVIVDIPWSRMEEYENIILAVVYKDCIIPVDFERIYDKLRDESKNTFYFEKNIDDLFVITTIPVSLGDAKNAWFSFSPPYDKKREASQGIDEEIKGLNPSKTRMVFFVYQDGHEIFYDYYYKYRDLGFNISWFAMQNHDNRHYIGYSYEGTKVQAE